MLILASVQWLSGHCLDADCNAILDDDLVDLCVTFEVQIVIL